MKIAVLIKHVPVSNNVSVDPITHALIRSSSEGMVNPSDLNAIEEAIRIKEVKGAEITAVTMGPPDAEKSLRDALALGCDDAILITDRSFAGGDTVATAKVLSEVLKDKFDLVFSGAMSSDGATGQVGAMVSEFLGCPNVTEASGFDIDELTDDKAYILKNIHGTEFKIEAILPAVVSFNFGVNEPRFATLRSKRSAKNKPLTVITNKELELSSYMIGLKGSPTAVMDSFNPESERKAVMLTGTPEELAQKMKELIEAKKEEI